MNHFSPSVQHFLRILFQNPNLMGKSASVRRFLAIFRIKTLRKGNFKIPCFQASQVEAGIAAARAPEPDESFAQLSQTLLSVPLIVVQTSRNIKILLMVQQRLTGEKADGRQRRRRSLHPRTAGG